MNQIKPINLVHKRSIIFNERIYAPINNKVEKIHDNSIILENNIYYSFSKSNIYCNEENKINK